MYQANNPIKSSLWFFFTICVLTAFFSCEKELDCADCPSQNHQPVANAGNDTLINLPGGIAILNGDKSSDMDGTIKTYQWKKISGPAICDLVTPTLSSTRAENLQEGVYFFELTVTDDEGLSAKDSVQVSLGLSLTCDTRNRRVVNARLVPVGKLSEARYELEAVTAGTKILFAGGLKNQETSSRVDIFDFVQNSWETAELSRMQTQHMATATAGNKIYFAGGARDVSDQTTSRVDIYDVVTGQWTQAELSEKRGWIAASTAGNKVLFGGGSHWNNGGLFTASKVLDIFDYSTGQWSTSSLSEPHTFHSSVSAGNKIYFAGGISSGDLIFTKRVEIFDVGTNSWSISEMLATRMFFAGIAFQNRIYWAGGLNANIQHTGSVEILDLTTGITTKNCIYPRSGLKAVVKNNMIVFFTGSSDSDDYDKFDIYDTVTGEWYIGKMDRNIFMAGIVSANNKIYIAGGSSDGTDYLDQVWTLEW